MFPTAVATGRFNFGGFGAVFSSVVTTTLYTPQMMTTALGAVTKTLVREALKRARIVENFNFYRKIEKVSNFENFSGLGIFG